MACKLVSPAFNIGFDVSYGAFRRPIDPNTTDKFVIFGLPRSGNTWLQTMIANVLDLPVIDPWVEVGRAGVGMCHMPVSKEIMARTDFVHSVCLVRDIRDIAASYFMLGTRDDWKHKSPWYKYDDPEQFYFEYFTPRMESIYDIHGFWDHYAALNLPVVRYEDMVRNPEAALGRVFDRVGLYVDPLGIREAVRVTRIEVLREGGAQGYEPIPGSHFGRGQVGSYAKDLPPKVVRDIERRYQGVLERWGYL
ncbi:MAG: hypothetical protein BroJett029_23260 [Alphaproteobacteria bacterium]|nr:MAG: hypothetical protein BroJett029_23260 [Alphaproteobacteria bacterium]